jgi:hypothetical protein
LTLIFIGVQTILANRKSGRPRVPSVQALVVRRQRQRLALGLGIVVMAAVVVIVSVSRSGDAASTETPETTQCVVKPFREEDAARLIKDGAAIVYNRTAGPLCVDELYAIYPDGRVLGNNGVNDVERQVDPAEVENLLTVISVDHQWFTNEIYSTYLNPCRQCFAHYISISYNGQEKAVTGVDGTTAMPPGYAFALAEIRPLLPNFAASE